MNKEIIKLENISYSYDGVNKALDDVSLTIKEGTYVSIIGHNGSGKSTLGKILSALLYTKYGKYFLYDTQVDDDNISVVRQNVGIVFQNPDNQFIGASVEDDIAFGLENKLVDQKIMKDLVNKYATSVSMENYLDKEPNSLSGGQKQRVAIAGVLSIEPNIIILDEATAMLDPRGKREIKELINEIRKDNPGLTVISITHDIEEAYESDEIFVIEKGKLILKGDPKDIFLNHEDKINEVKLDMPFILKLKKELKKANLNVDSADNIDEIVEILCR